MTTEPDVLDLLSDVDAYLCALHVHVARHDQIGADGVCGGCLLRERVAAALGSAVPVPPPADQTALRDRIRRAVCEAEGFGWDTDMLEPDEYGEVADAVMAVLPEHADRAAVLEEAAGRYEEMLAKADTAADPRYWTAVRDITLGLRRLAAEAQPITKPEDGTRTADLLAESATEYRVPVPEGGGTDLLVRRQALVHGAGWTVSTSARGGGRAWTAEGWQDSISALSVDRLFCWPDADTAVTEARRALAAGVRQDGAQPQGPPVVAYRSDGGRLLNCLRHVPPPAARHADFHPVTAEDLPDGGICTYPECGVDVLIPQEEHRG